MHASPISPKPVDAATVVLMRDVRPGGGGLEVLLLERHLASDFAGGALVFPGGKVNPSDCRLPASHWQGRPLADWVGPLGVERPEQALGLLVAAVRETFEEAGVLFARWRNGSPVTEVDLERADFVEARRRLIDRDRRWSWNDWLVRQNLLLDLGALALWAWWVTPEGQHRRFDTRFLAALMPARQRATQDDVETTALRWMAPQAALDAQARGAVTIIYPTRKNLQALARYATAQQAWQAAFQGDVDQRRIQPTMIHVDGRPMVQHPDGGAPEPI